MSEHIKAKLYSVIVKSEIFTLYNVFMQMSMKTIAHAALLSYICNKEIRDLKKSITYYRYIAFKFAL